MKSLSTFSLLLVLTTAAVAQPGPLVPEDAITRIGDHTWYIPDQNRPAVPYVGIVVGNNATLVIDPGLGRRNGETVLKQVAQVSNNQRIYIATTHFHPEHTTGYVAFPDSAIYINSNVQEAEFAETGEQFVQLFASRSELMAELLTDAERKVADITFDQEYRLDLGGVTVHFMEVGPTHTKGDLGFFVEQDGVLFSGDVVMRDSFWMGFPGTVSAEAWLAAFDTFEALGPRVIVPSHGPIGDGSLIAEQRTAMEQIRDRALALKAQGVAAEEAGAQVQQQMQAMHPDWPRAQGIPALVGSVWQEAE